MSENRLSVGITGLNEVIGGGLIPQRSYLVRGGPGTGKTTLGFHFLAAGVALGEKVLFITLGEPEAQLRANAEWLGFDIEAIPFLDLSPSSEFFTEVQTYDIFSASEVEREPTTQKIIEQVQAVKPQRVFLDAITQFRYLATDEFQFRKQVLSFLRFLVEGGATVVFTSEGTSSAPDDDLQFISDGVIYLELLPEGRTVSVTKFRGSNFRDGRHSLRLSETGMQIFPRLLPDNYQQDFISEPISSGIPEMDEMLHGGLERGTVSVISGPSGVGKTTVGIQFMKEAAARGERSVVYIFEESTSTLLHRCESVNIPIQQMIEQKSLSVIPVEPLLYSPDEFANMVRTEVEDRQTRIVMIDSISGYQLSMRGQDLVSNLHALCKYLKNMGVTVILINEIETLAGDFRMTEVGISYLADSLVFIRYLEHQLQAGTEICKAIGVIKKRVSNFEKTMRELDITRYGIKVSKPIRGLRGILSAAPLWMDVESED
ncbi:ATPase domain-containing protein [Microcoleus sp. F10-C6]|uniref:ATPase domain-containing protein n=1 Tax=unclassified Microcoleus TaxID=2642155 RepID=UPI002FD6B5C8